MKFKIKFKSALAGLRPCAQLLSLRALVELEDPLGQRASTLLDPTSSPQEPSSGEQRRLDRARSLEPQRAATYTSKKQENAGDWDPSPGCPSWTSGHAAPRCDQRIRMGTPGLRARGLSCDSPASHKLHSACDIQQAVHTWQDPRPHPVHLSFGTRGGVRSQSVPKLEEGLPFPFRWILGHGACRSRTELISLPLLGGTQTSREPGWD